MSDHYDNNLTHVAEPATPGGRKKAVSFTVTDFEALWLAEQLREFAHYGAREGENDKGIALAYVEYIRRKVREQGRRYVTVYAHTGPATDALVGCLYEHDPDNGLDKAMVAAVSGPIAEVYIDHAEEYHPEPTEVSDLETVEFEEGAAKEHEADRQIAEAESEWEREQEKRAARRGVTGLPETNPAIEGPD